MEKIPAEVPENKKSNEEEKITRRRFLQKIKKLSIAAGTVAVGKYALGIKEALGEKEPDEEGFPLLSFEKIEARYEKFYREEEARPDRIIKEGSKYIADYQGEKIEIPESFIHSFLNHLEQAKKAGYYDFLFFDDLFHCHTGLPKEYFDKDYKDLSLVEKRKKSLEDPRLIHVYHSREGLERENPKSKTRNFLGYFDGRDVKLIHPKEENRGHTVFDYDREEMSQYDDYYSMPQAGVIFEANKNGLFRLSDGTKMDIII